MLQRSRRAVGRGAIVAIVLFSGTSARAQDPAPGGSAEPKVSTSCTEYVPKGATPPRMEASLEERGLSGYAVWLTVKVVHGPGETVMPEGFRIQRGSEAVQALRESGWVIPEPGGGAAPVVERGEGDGPEVETSLKLPFVPLPKEPGRHRLVLPPIPIAVARASGQVMTLCTAPQTVVVDDPIANEVEPEVKPNPAPRPQREEWLLAKYVTAAVLGAIALGILLAWLLRKWARKPRPAPQKPKELPWVAALKELESIRSSPLLEEGRYDEYFDRIDNCLRFYLGDRYGFDGLESTSAEIRALLSRVYPPIQRLKDIDRFLEDTDLIKFTELRPAREDCDEVTGRAQAIIVGTTPAHRAPPGDRRAA